MQKSKVRFTKADRSTFPYWFAHWCAYNMVALNWGVWKPHYLFHDIEKPWMLLFWKLMRVDNPYKRVQKWHRTHNAHHLEYKNKKKRNWVDMLIDWEASMYTKQAAPRNAVEEIEWEYQAGWLNPGEYRILKFMAFELGLISRFI